MSALTVHVEGIGLWTPQLTGFAALQALLQGGEVAPSAARPPAAMLPPNERRRAPESVLLAAEVAGQAVAMSGRPADDLACVFASSHGDQGITDYMCATLATAPAELSPTRFHNSVHNAPVGYWTIATGCHAPSTAVCAHHESFGAGLLEAAALVATEQRPVLLACSDIAGSGPLGEVTGCAEAFACALLLAPPADAAPFARLALTLTGAGIPAPLAPPLEGWRQRNPSAAALGLLAALAQRLPDCALQASPHAGLRIRLDYDR